MTVIDLHILADEFGLGWIYPPPPLEQSSIDSEIFESARPGTKWIVLSSAFFSIPAIWHLIQYASYVQFKINYYIHAEELTGENVVYIKSIMTVSVNLLLTSLISMNYWRDPKRGWRRNADLIFAKFFLLMNCYYAFKYVRYSPYVISLFCIILSLPWIYNQSTKLISQNNPDWVKYHFAFHVVSTLGLAVLLDGIHMRINEQVLNH
jgi:hypothetical protein